MQTGNGVFLLRSDEHSHWQWLQLSCRGGATGGVEGPTPPPTENHEFVRQI